MTKKVFIPEGATIVGPYSPAVEAGNLVYFSGQIPVENGKIIEGDTKIQMQQCLKNLSTVLETANLTSDNVIKSTIYLTNMDDYAVINEVYAEYFNAPYPARTAICVSALPLGAKVEIEVIAQKF